MWYRPLHTYIHTYVHIHIYIYIVAIWEFINLVNWFFFSPKKVKILPIFASKLRFRTHVCPKLCSKVVYVKLFDFKGVCPTNRNVLSSYVCQSYNTIRKKICQTIRYAHSIVFNYITLCIVCVLFIFIFFKKS